MGEVSGDCTFVAIIKLLQWQQISTCSIVSIEYSENKMIVYFENEVGPVVI